MVKSFVSTEARILQQPHLPSSDFENFFSISTTCAFDQHLASRQREANSTAFQTAVNRLLYRFRSSRPNPFRLKHYPLKKMRILRSFRCFATPFFKSNFLFYKKFKELLTPEERAHYRDWQTKVNRLLRFCFNTRELTGCSHTNH